MTKEFLKTYLIDMGLLGDDVESVTVTRKKPGEWSSTTLFIDDDGIARYYVSKCECDAETWREYFRHNDWINGEMRLIPQNWNPSEKLAFIKSSKPLN